MVQPGQEDTYSEAETVARREAALKRMLATPHKPHKKPSPTTDQSRRGGLGEGQNKQG